MNYKLIRRRHKMKHTIIRSTRPLLVAVLVAGACNVMAAQRLELHGVNLNAPSQTPKTILSLTGLSSAELEFQYAEKMGPQNVSRFQQFYRGIPILGEAVVAKVFGDPIHAAPTAMSGVILRNLDQDLPSIKPAISEKTALDQAKTLSRTQNTSAEKVNLYIQQGANGAAHLVYIVSFKNDSAAVESRPSYLIDATSGAVLDRWEGMEKARKFGPGDTYKKAFEALAQMPGWNSTKANQVIGYARDVYWTEGSKLNQGACGAEKAAADLGWNVADVTAAFNLAGTCRGSTAIDTIAEAAPIDLSTAVFGKIIRMDEPQPSTAPSSGARQPQRITSTGSLGTSTAWKPLGSNVTKLGSHGNFDFARKRWADTYTSITGIVAPLPQSVCFNDYLVRGTADTWNVCLHTDGWNNLQYRYIGTGTYTKDTVPTAWSNVSGYNSIVQRNYLSTEQTIGGALLYSQITAIGTNWSVGTSVSLTVTETLSVPLVEETSISVTVGVTSTVGGDRSVTRVENYYSPQINVPAGKAVRYTLKERWQPIRTVWSVPVQFTGWVGADYSKGWNGHHSYAVSSGSYFSEYGTGAGKEKASIIVNQKKYHDITIVAEIIN
jgi:hypothetical protein